MKSIALAVLVVTTAATVAGCAVVPVVPPLYVGARVDYGSHYGWHDPGPRGWYGPGWRRW